MGTKSRKKVERKSIQVGRFQEPKASYELVDNRINTQGKAPSSSFKCFYPNSQWTYRYLPE